MIRLAALALCTAACGRPQGVSDQDLPGLVVEARKAEAAIDVERAARDPQELGRALARPYRAMREALGPHSVAVNSATTVEEAGKPVSELSDHARIDNGDAATYKAVYTNSADYGRETIHVGGRLYLRPRYQRWHVRDPESPDEAAALRDRYFEAIAATWDLLAPAAELADRGAIEVAGRAGRKIEVRRSADPRDPPAEPVAQRKWRERRSVDAVTGEIVLDTEHGVPLAVKLTGNVAFSRDGRRFAMKVAVDSTISGLGSAAAIPVPSDTELVETPERMREVDERDYLLQGIAPALRRNADGTAVPPAPVRPDGSKPGAPSQPSPGKPGAPPSPAKPGAQVRDDAAGRKPDGARP
jgi:hypothetical protein